MDTCCRIIDQDIILQSQILIKNQFTNRFRESGKEYCEFCGARFGNLKREFKKGYCTQNYYYWICDACFEEQKDEFDWMVKN